MHDLASLADLGNLARTTRVARGLTQAELAARLGLGLRLVSEVELGVRDLRTSNLLHILGRLGFDLKAVPRGGVAVTAPATAPHENRQRVRKPRPAKAATGNVPVKRGRRAT